MRSHHAEFEPRHVGQARCIPRRVEDQLDLDLVDAVQGGDGIVQVLAQDVAHPAERRRDRHVDLDAPAAAAALGEKVALAGKAESYAGALKSLKSMGAVVLIVSLDRKMTGFYWHNLPKDAGFPFLAFVEHTNFMDRAHYGGDTLVYCGDYLETDHEYFRLSKEELLDRFLPAFKRFNPAFDRRWVKEAWLWKAPYAQPVPTVNHSKNIPPLRTPVPGLYFASMSQVYPWDRGTNYAVEIGRRVAGLVMEDLQGK